MNMFDKKYLQKIALLGLIISVCQLDAKKDNQVLDSINAVLAQSAQTQKQLADAARITSDEKEAMAKKYFGLLSEHKICEDRLDAYKKECRALEESIASTKKEAQAKLAHMQIMVESAEKEFKNINNERNQIIKKHEQECALLREEKNRLAAQCAEFSAQMKNQVPSLSKELKNAQHELAQKTKALADMTEKCDQIKNIALKESKERMQQHALVDSTQKDLKNIINERDQAIKKYERECALLRESKEKLAAQCVELTEQMKNQVPSLSKELKTAQLELAQKTKALAVMSEKCAQIKNNVLKECESRIQKLVFEKEKNMQSYEQKMASLTKEMEKKNAELAQCQARTEATAAHLTKLAHDATQERDAMALKCSTLSTEYTSFKVESQKQVEQSRKMTEQARKAFEKTVADLNQMLEKKTAELNANRTNRDAMTTQLAEANQHSKAERAQLQESHKMLTNECAGLKKEIARLDAEKTRMASQLLAMEQKNAAKQNELSDQLKNAQAALKESKHLCQSLEQSLAKNTKQLNAQANVEATLSKHRETEKNLCARLEAMKEEHQRQREALVAQVTEQQSIIQQTKLQQNATNNSLQALQTSNYQLQDSFDAMKQKLSSCQKEYANHAAARDQLMSKMDALNRENNMLRASFDRALQTKDTMHQELKAQLNEHKIQCKSLEKQNGLLQKELELASKNENGMQCALSEKIASLIKEHENYKAHVAAERVKRQQVIQAAKKPEQIKLKTPLEQTLDKKCVQMKQEKKVRQVVAKTPQNKPQAVAKTNIVKKQQPKVQESASQKSMSPKRRSLFGGRASKVVSKN